MGNQRIENTYVEYVPGTKHSKKDSETSPYHETFEDCGILIKSNEVVIDIDELPKETIKKLISHFDINTQTVWTDRGAHLTFLKPTTGLKAYNGICALGFKIETKNSSNSPDGITFKRNGVCREHERLGVRQELPWYFYKKKSGWQNLLGMTEGEERNKKLYAHKIMLENHPDTKKILRFINKYLFAEPLDEDEFETVARDQITDTSKATEYEIATQVMNTYRVVSHRGLLWWWDGQRYKTDCDNYSLIRTIHTVCPGKPTRFVDEVIKQLTQRADRYRDDKEFDIRIKNGIIHKGQFILADEYSEFTPYRIGIDYKHDAKPVPIIDQYIKNIVAGDGEWTEDHEEYRKLLIEVLAYPLLLNIELIRVIGKFFIFRGDGGNGKGTFLQIMKKIYGCENCTALSIKELGDPRYSVTTEGKLVNLGDDIEPDAIDNHCMKVIKNITTADTVETRKLYHQSESKTLSVKLIFTTNADIKTMEKGYAYQRRVMWLPMFNKVEKPDSSFITKMTTPEALEYWLRLLMEGYQRLYTNKMFTKSKIVNDYNKRYHEMNNPMKEFVEAMNDTGDLEAIFVKRTVSEIKEEFAKFTGDNETKFSQKMLQEALEPYGIKYTTVSSGGKKYKSYIFVEK